MCPLPVSVSPASGSLLGLSLQIYIENRRSPREQEPHLMGTDRWIQQSCPGCWSRWQASGLWQDCWRRRKAPTHSPSSSATEWKRQLSRDVTTGDNVTPAIMFSAWWKVLHLSNILVLIPHHFQDICLLSLNWNPYRPNTSHSWRFVTVASSPDNFNGANQCWDCPIGFWCGNRLKNGHDHSLFSVPRFWKVRQKKNAPSIQTGGISMLVNGGGM